MSSVTPSPLAITVAAVGQSGNANGAVVTGGRQLALQEADSSFPGVISSNTFNLYNTLGAISPGQVQTSDATPTIITGSEYDLNQPSACVTLQVIVLGVETVSGGDCASYGIVGLFQNVAGTVSKIGSTAVLWARESDAAWDCVFDIAGTVISVQVTGAAATNILWNSTSRLNG